MAIINNDPVSVIGAGLVGSLLSVYLAKEGYEVSLYETRPDLRKADISAGRSINLALSDRGWKSLDKVGIAESVRKMAIPMLGRMIHSIDHSVNFQPYGIHNQAINSVSRGGLNAILMDHAEINGVKMYFEKGLRSVDVNSNTLDFYDGDKVASEMIFGADGAFSKVRGSMMKSDRFNYSQYYLEHGYKELTIPPDANGKWLLEKNALHIWPRGNLMLIALPNMDGSFTCTLFAPFEGDNSFERVNDNKDLIGFFTAQFPDVIPLMPGLEEDYFTNPTSSLVTVRCFPWTLNNKIAIIGDASHAIVPFYGQGMISGFEDCRVLSDIMEENPNNWPKVLSLFETSRKPNTDAIADLAFRNFIEMRDKVADSEFLYRKKLERKLHVKYPDEFIPLYSQVTFSDIPYSKALESGKIQDRYFNKVLKDINIEVDPDEKLMDELIKEWRKFR